MFILISVGSPPPFEPSDLPCLPEFRISNEDFPACNFLDGCSKTFAIEFEQILVIFLGTPYIWHMSKKFQHN